MKELAFAAAVAAAALVALAVGGSATGNETINYSYDAQGRLIQAKHSGTGNSNVTVDQGFDNASNRVLLNVVGAP
jgi:YD repeat-containing protein